MKKSYIIGGVSILAIALGFVIYINMKGPSKSSDSNTTVASNGQGSDSGNQGGFGPGSDGDSQGGLNGVVTLGDSKNQVLENVVVNSRIAEEFKFLDEQMEAQYETLKKMAGPEELAIFERLRDQLKGDDLLAQFREVLKQKFSEDQLAQLSQVYQNPAYIKYQEIQAGNRKPEVMAAIGNFQKTYKFENEPADRQAALREHVAKSGGVEDMMGMLKNVETIFGGGMSKPNNADVKKYEDLLRSSLEQSLIAAAAYNFKDTDSNGIREYTNVVGNDLVRQANAAKTEFVGETLVRVAKPEVDKQLADAQK